MDNIRNYKRRNFFVKKKLQIHFALSSFALLLFSTVAVWVMMNMVFHFYLADRWGGELSQQMFFSRTNTLVLVFILVDAIAVLLLSVYFSHFIAGPIYHLEKNLKNIIDNKKVEKIFLRKHDHLQDTMDLVNEVLDKLSPPRK